MILLSSLIIIMTIMQSRFPLDMMPLTFDPIIHKLGPFSTEFH